jgi:4-amino-4-deoxy-L-arabinose transferase-like glycosyltransferase
VARSIRNIGPEGLALAVILVVATAVRLYYVRTVSMRGDEAFTFNEYASKSLDDVFVYTFPNNHVLYTLLVHGATRTLGPEPWVVRLPALLAGLALIPATYALARRLCDGAAGILAAALVASSDVLISYSANGRGYTLLALFAVVLASIASRLVEGGRPRDWAAFTVLTPLGFLTIPIMLYPFGGIVTWMVLAWLAAKIRGRPTLRLDRLACAVMVAGLLTVVLYLPVVSRSGVESVVANRIVAPRRFEEVVRELPGSLAAVWIQWNLDLPRVVAWGLVAAWALSLIGLALARGGCGAPSALTLIVFGWTLAVVLAQRVVPFDRVWLFLLPFYAACVASGVGSIVGWLPGIRPSRKSVACSVLAVLLALGQTALVVRNGEIPTEAARLSLNHGEQIARELKARLRPGDAVIAELPCDAPLKYDLILQGIPVEVQYDYRVAAARRIYIAVNRPNGQDPDSVLRWNHVRVPPEMRPHLIEDYGTSALYLLDREDTVGTPHRQ